MLHWMKKIYIYIYMYYIKMYVKILKILRGRILLSFSEKEKDSVRSSEFCRSKSRVSRKTWKRDAQKTNGIAYMARAKAYCVKWITSGQAGSRERATGQRNPPILLQAPTGWRWNFCSVVVFFLFLYTAPSSLSLLPIVFLIFSFLVVSSCAYASLIQAKTYEIGCIKIVKNT